MSREVVRFNRVNIAGVCTVAAPALQRLRGRAFAHPENTSRPKLYDSDKFARELMERHGVEVIAPVRRNRKVITQDLRPLRRYKEALQSRAFLRQAQQL